MDDDVSKAERRRRKMSAATTLDLSATEVQPEADSAKVAPMAGETTANDARPEKSPRVKLAPGRDPRPGRRPSPSPLARRRRANSSMSRLSRDEPGLMPLVAAALIGRGLRRRDPSLPPRSPESFGLSFRGRERWNAPRGAGEQEQASLGVRSTGRRPARSSPSSPPRRRRTPSAMR